MPKPTTRLLAAVAAGVAMCAAATSAWSQTLSFTNSCVFGQVNAGEYAELSANFREYGWDSWGSLRLLSDDEELTLQVLDLNMTNVCENVADLRTTCTWRLSPGGEYFARVDNTMRSTETTYRLCAN